MTRWILCILAFSASGCTASYNTEHLSGDQSVTLDPEKAVYIAVPRDGSYGNTVYNGSGQTTAQSVSIAFSRHAAQVSLADEYGARNDVIELARSEGASYLVWPVITHWEQRATAWSGLPSRMAIRVTVINLETETQLTSSIIEGRSRIMSMTNTHPESLLRDPLRAYVNSIY